ncbi:MAG: hypothetical protein R2720_12895 [Candidatus Nanopelagicales bacterium]
MRARRVLGLISVAATVAAIGPTPAHAAHGIPPRLVGFYYQHAGGMTVRSNGTVTVVYQWYYKRDNGMPTFPRLTLEVDTVRGRTLKGRVVSQRKSPVQVGSRFTLKRKAPGMRLRLAGFPHRWYFCDDSHQGQCGA